MTKLEELESLSLRELKDDLHSLKGTSFEEMDALSRDELINEIVNLQDEPKDDIIYVVRQYQFEFCDAFAYEGYTDEEDAQEECDKLNAEYGTKSKEELECISVDDYSLEGDHYYLVDAIPLHKRGE